MCLCTNYEYIMVKEMPLLRDDGCLCILGLDIQLELDHLQIDIHYTHPQCPRDPPHTRSSNQSGIYGAQRDREKKVKLERKEKQRREGMCSTGRVDHTPPFPLPWFLSWSHPFLVLLKTHSHMHMCKVPSLVTLAFRRPPQHKNERRYGALLLNM